MADENKPKSATPEPQPHKPAPTLVAQAEAVFESYLAARVVNARRELQAAKSALLADRHNRAKIDAVQRAEVGLEKLQAQLIEQKRNAARVRARADGSTAAEPVAPSTDGTHLTARFTEDAVTIPFPPGRPRR